MEREKIAEVIRSGKAVLGMEFGSTRIKAVLVDPEGNPIASGSHGWENRLENQIWTYSLKGYPGRIAGLLCGTETGCKGKIWRDTDTACCHGFQWYDAWIHGI